MKPDVEPVIDIREPDADAPSPLVPGSSSEREATDAAPSHRAAGPHDRIRKVIAIVFIATVLLGAGAVTLTRSPYFAAHRILVHGTSHIGRSDLLRMAGITPDTNVFTLDVGSAEVQMERDPWIARATITKDLPSTLIIDIHERTAVAVVGSGGALRLVADDGALLERAPPRVAVGMPTIASTVGGVELGPAAIGGAARAIAAMAPNLRTRIDGVSILADGQLRVDLSSGAEVAYGDTADLSEKAMALRALLDYALAKGASVVSADVRVPSAPTAVLSGGVVAP